MKIKKTRWRDVTINEYNRINEIISSDISDAEKDVALLAIMCDVSEDEIWELGIDEVRSLRAQMMFIEKMPATDNVGIQWKRITVGDFECEVVQDLSKMTYAQFVDFQQYIADEKNNKAQILSVFLIPKGHKYGDGYDMVRLQQQIGDEISIDIYRQVWFFFLKKYQALLSSTATSLAYRMQARAYLMRKRNPLREKYLTMAKLLKQVPSTLG